MEIREFRTEDAIEASSIIKECFQKLDIGGHTAAGIQREIDHNSSENLTMGAEQIRYFVAVDNNKVIGICGYDQQKVRTLFVNIKYHKLGIGKKLLNTVLSEAKKEGLTSLITWSTMFAEGFYSLAGFQKIKNIVIPPDNADIVLIEMVKQL